MRPALVLSGVLALILTSGCGGGADAPTPGSTAFVVGQAATDPNGWMEYIPGDAPIVIIAPHGGTLTPTELPDRTCSGCETANDLNTQDLARRIVDAFYTRTGARPHLVVNRLSRKKFDANRDLAEASGGTAKLSAPWTWFHAAIDSAEQRIVQRSGRGLVIDLHGHAHDVDRLELGYFVERSGTPYERRLTRVRWGDDTHVDRATGRRHEAHCRSRRSAAAWGEQPRCNDRRGGISCGTKSLRAVSARE